MPEPKNIIAAFFKTARERGSLPCTHHKMDNKWRILTWFEMADAVRKAAAGLKRLGIRHGDRVVICAQTSLDWTIADMAIMAAGGITVPIYPSLTSERIAQILKNSTPRLIFVGDGKTHLHIDEALLLCAMGSMQVLALQSFTRILSATDEEKDDIDRVAFDIKESDEATCVYTSGTTGEQKGVVLTHGNILSEIRAAQEIFNFSPDDVGLQFLPLAHVLGRLIQFYQLVQGCQMAYAESIEKLAANYLEIRPHFVCGVPRMLEKVYELVWLRVQGSSWLKKLLFRMGLAAGTKRSQYLEQKKQMSIPFRFLCGLADLVIFRKIRAGLGGRMHCFISGGAPLKVEVARFFHASGLLVLEGYGLTETFAAATVNRFENYRFGTVGKPLPGVELKVAEDGEIMFRGPTVFKEYKDLPDETRAAFDSDGWFLTGDLGELLSDGFLRITGRKKEMLVTAGGKNIAPQMIEALMSGSPYIGYFMAYGEGRKYITGLVVMNTEAARQYLLQHGYSAKDAENPARHPEIRMLVEGHIEAQNRKLAPFETVKKFAIVDGEFSVATGELTPTLKIRRDFVGRKYREVMEGLYA